jgi:prepilin-type processing-associated H-X9-DG protein
MSSFVPGFYVRRKLADIKNPAQKLMLCEEPNSPQELASGDPGGSPMVDGRWTKPDTITTRHNGKGNSNFADGHADRVDWKFASDTNHIDFSL